MTRALSPTTLILICWVATCAIAGVTLANLGRFDLVALFMSREKLDVSAFTPAGAIWIILSILVYFAGDLAARISVSSPKTVMTSFDLERASTAVFFVNLVLISITGLWIILSAANLGGLVNLAAMAYTDSTGARDVLLGNKLFTGMRLFYAALPATGCMATAILTMALYKPLSRKARILCFITLSINVVALFVLPMVMSQRLLLFQLLISSYLVTCVLRKRIAGLGWLAFASLLFLTTWVLRESVTNILIQRSALDIGVQKLAFYYVNDLWNGFAPLHVDIPHTFGGVSLRGFMFLTFTDGMFTQILAPKMADLDSVLGGGDFPFFTAAFVDFGPLFGALFIGFCAFVFRLVFVKAHQSVIWACIYSQLGAALLFSTHGIYFTHQNFLFSIAIIGLMWLLVCGKSFQPKAYRSSPQNA
jgi:hypothetical protein